MTMMAPETTGTEMDMGTVMEMEMGTGMEMEMGMGTPNRMETVIDAGSKSKNYKVSGFTLIELTVACAIIFLVTAAVYGLLYSGVASYNFSGDQAEIQQNARAAIYRMAVDIKNAQKIITSRFSTTTTTPTSTFLSSAESSELYLKTEDSGYPQVREIWYLLNGNRLMRQLRTETGSLIKEEIVAEYVKDLKFTDIQDDFVTITVSTGKGTAGYTVSTAVSVSGWED